ncbi:DUF2786 domain-containing protein [Streptomyces sp. NPDC001255]|uniref:DUF2786 domain-containing protein n=1 Tax=Streptomyces sp. NPDC001255 TaxID=3364550 RepID=UPI0036A3DD37
MAENAKLARVRALLANAEDPATTPEAAETYRTRAFALMARYGIEMAALSAAGQHPGDHLSDRMFWLSAPWTREQASLLNRVALASNCSAINLGIEDTGSRRLVRVFGFSGDLERVEILYSSLRVQMLRELELAQVPWHVQSGGPTRAWRRSFLVGFCSEVGRRMEEAQERATAETPTVAGHSTELVLSSRSEKAAQAMRGEYPGVRTVRRKLSGTGGAEGRRAGARADIGSGRIGGSRQPLG